MTITAEQIPKEALVAYQRAFKNGGGPADGIAAALNAWPGVEFKPTHLGYPAWPHIILPLPQKEPRT